MPIVVLIVSLAAGCVINRPQPVVVPATTTTAVYKPGYVVTTLPVGYKTVRVNRNIYYVDKDVYYQAYPRGGYIVVERPL